MVLQLHIRHHCFDFAEHIITVSQRRRRIVSDDHKTDVRNFPDDLDKGSLNKLFNAFSPGEAPDKENNSPVSYSQFFLARFNTFWRSKSFRIYPRRNYRD